MVYIHVTSQAFTKKCHGDKNMKCVPPFALNEECMGELYMKKKLSLDVSYFHEKHQSSLAGDTL